VVMPRSWKRGLHVDAQRLVVAVDAGPAGGFAPYAGLRMLARMGAMTWSRRARRAVMVRGYLVAVGSAGFGDEFFAAEFAQVVGGVAYGVVGVPGDCAPWWPGR
jgi:hypothetical protein